MVTPSNRALLWTAFLGSRLFVFLASTEAAGDVGIYHRDLSAMSEEGSPYRGEGSGYPPLALFYVGIPYLITDDLAVYYQLFRAQSYLVDLAIFVLLARRSLSAALLYTVSTTILANLLYHRLDLMLGLLLLGALILRERGWWRAAYGTLGLGAAFKVIPVLAVPALLVWEARQAPRRAVGSACAFAAGAMVPTAIGLLLWGSDALFFLGGHAARGVQLESTWASVEILLVLFGWEGQTYWAAGCYNLHTAAEPFFIRASHWLGGLVALGGAVLALRTGPSGRNVYVLTTVPLAAALLVSKVLSPQYFLFLLPPLAMLLRTGRRLERGLLVLICALTTYVYPYHEHALTALEPAAVVPLLARNFLYALLVALLVRSWWSEGSGGEKQRP